MWNFWSLLKSLYLIRWVVQFISNYADDFGLSQPVAPRGRDGVPPIYIPSDTIKKDVHEKYVETLHSTFWNIWNHIYIRMLNRENMFVPIGNSYRNVIGCSLRRGKVRGRKKDARSYHKYSNRKKSMQRMYKKVSGHILLSRQSQNVCIHNQSSSFSVTHDKRFEA